MRPPEETSFAQREERRRRSSSVVLMEQEETRPPTHPLANLLASSTIGTNHNHMVVLNDELAPIRLHRMRLSPPPSPAIESAMVIQDDTQQLMLLSARRSDNQASSTPASHRGISLMQFTSSPVSTSSGSSLGSSSFTSLTQATLFEREVHGQARALLNGAQRSAQDEDNYFQANGRTVFSHSQNDENFHPHHRLLAGLHSGDNSMCSIGSNSSCSTLSSILNQYAEPTSSATILSSNEEEDDDFDENSPSALAAFFQQLSLATMGSHAQVIFHDDLLSFILSQRVLERSAFANNALVEALQLYLTLPIECTCGIPDDHWTLSACKCAQRAIWQLKERVSDAPQPPIR
ncbi:hypothetical protein MDAP_000579 [Mitosporidium daphniae]|uniref:Uncharacterized protein n=1 Tax=Mitosporidium daphniae TaxID=1485682 RepID=A0A098VNA5_9MICR|nr:uncharacterized protein DI09_70p50 [Mitosporidium daphniae]KGG50410.1 hypothetical protein DI09_70p50 [Mitosporidium daphniae]|eukprot:XP_013236848.1 uncharacterized protein DI09_70p50 [Mitosporidium daphniae]